MNGTLLKIMRGLSPVKRSVAAKFANEFGAGDMTVTDKIYRYWGKTPRAEEEGLNKSAFIFCHYRRISVF